MYSRQFKGSFFLNKPMDEVTYNFLKKLNATRRVARKVEAIYGVDGEFFVDTNAGNTAANDLTKYPRTQPSLWCHWKPVEDKLHIEWDGEQNFDKYVEWIEYIISKVLAPRGYLLNGIVFFRGENWDDDGKIEIHDNNVNGKRLITDFTINKCLGAVGATTTRRRNTSPSLTSKPAAATSLKSSYKLIKEKAEEQTAKLEAQIKLLEEQLKEKSEALTENTKKIKEFEKKAVEEKAKLSVKDTILKNMMVTIQFGGNLDDFKKMLMNLLTA